jgi:hypothetical protein
LQEYRRKKPALITAVRLELDTDGFTYQKWGGAQHCKRGDWLVKNQDDVYTIDAETFERTYRMVSPGLYEKSGPVWVEVASQPGSIQTKEGLTVYAAGDYLVFNDPGCEDGYAMKASTFQDLYESSEQ